MVARRLLRCSGRLLQWVVASIFGIVAGGLLR